MSRVIATAEDSLFDLLPEELDRYPVGVITVDRHGTVLRYNQAESAFARLHPMEVVGRNFFSEVAPCTQVREFAGRFASFAAARDTGAERFDFTFAFGWGKQDVGITLLRRADFDEIHIIVRVRSMLRPAPDLEPEASAAAAPEALGESPAEDAGLLGHWVDDLTAGESFWSRELLQILELPEAGFVPSPEAYLRFVHPDDLEAVRAALRDARSAGRPYSLDHRLRTAAGETRYVHFQGMVYRDADGVAARLLGTVLDVTQRRRSARRLWRRAHYDELTGLPNRAYFMQHLENALGGGAPLAVLFLDLDRFKLVNDTAGHAVGDQVLRLTASRLVGCAGPNATVARLNGDEFVVLLRSAGSRERAGAVAEAIMESLAQPFVIDDERFYVTSSIGIALSPDDGHDAERLLAAADIAMYHAKQRGANGYLHYARAIGERAARAALREHDLRLAAGAGQFRLAYQPIFETETQRLAAVEALIRWDHPSLGSVAPGEFIGIAERTGLIVAIGNWALREACAQLRAWQRAGIAVPRITVNISPFHFKAPRFLETVQQALSEHGLAPDMLELEITENVIVDRFDETLGLLADLKLLKVRLSIDDFGTGYSALSYLKFLPVDALKLDRAFVTGLGTHSLDEAIAATILALARKLHLDVVAEGVETAQQLAALRAMDCTHVQGFLLGMPMRPEELASLASPQLSRAAAH